MSHSDLRSRVDLIAFLLAAGLFFWRVPVGCGQEADPKTKQEVADLLDRGVKDFQASRYAAALERFQSAYALLPDARILFNIASALRALGADAEAATAYDQYIQATASHPEEPKKRDALAALGQLVGRLARLDLESDPTAVERFLDGKRISVPMGQTLYVSPGAHDLAISFPGYRPKTVKLVLLRGEQRRVHLEMERVGEVAPAAPPLPPAPAAPRRRVLTWIAAGVGVAALAGAIGLGAHVRSLNSDLQTIACSNAACPELERHRSTADQASTEATLANVLFASAGAALVTAVVLYFYEGRSNASDQLSDRASNWKPALDAAPGAWTLAARRSF